MSAPSSRPLRILLYGDFRTSHANGWLAGLRAAGMDVQPLSGELVSVQHADVPQVVDPVARLRRLLVSRGLNTAIRTRLSGPHSAEPGTTARGRTIDPLQLAETALTPTRMPWQVSAIRRRVRLDRPDIVHALRMPYEGLLTLAAVRDLPVVVSSWGQDFTSQSARDPLLRFWMTRVAGRISGLHVDAVSDRDRAMEHGLSPHAPWVHAAGNFGVDTTLFYPAQPPGPLRVVYPRGRRSYVNHRAFLEVAAASASDERLHFIGVGLAGDPDAELLAARLGPGRLTLTPELPRTEFAAVLRSSSFVLSPATSDGTPNSVLEALACGAAVVGGGIPSVSALLAPPTIGRLVDPHRPDLWVGEFAAALRLEEHLAARRLNPDRVSAEYRIAENLKRIPDFYADVLRYWEGER